MDIQSKGEEIFGQEEGRIVWLYYFQEESLRFRMADKFRHTWNRKEEPARGCSMLIGVKGIKKKEGWVVCI